MSGEIIYFAYGSNLSHQQMQQRCPGCIPLTPGRLIHYRFYFGGYSRRWGGAVADVVPDEEYYVEGGLYRLEPTHIKSLDQHEGVPDFYIRHDVEVMQPSGEHVRAVIYRMAKKYDEGKPSREYLETIIRGFFDFDIVPPPEVSTAEYVE